MLCCKFFLLRTHVMKKCSCLTTVHIQRRNVTREATDYPAEEKSIETLVQKLQGNVVKKFLLPDDSSTFQQEFKPVSLVQLNPVAVVRSSKWTRASGRFQNDSDIDAKLNHALNNKQIDVIVELLNVCLQRNVIPSKKTLVVMARVSAEHGNTEGLKQARTLCREGFPQEYSFQGCLEHYEAELLWKVGDWDAAITKFSHLLKRRTHLRRKYHTMVTFLAIHLVHKELEEHLPRLIQLGRDCAAHDGDYFVMGAVWKACFLSPKAAFRLVALDLIEMYPKLRRCVVHKVNSILHSVTEQEDETDLLRRLMEVVLRLKLTQLYPKVFGTLLHYQCKLNSLNLER